MALKLGNVVQGKVGTVARTDTANKFLFTLPAGVMISDGRAFGVNSDSATSATLTIQVRPVDGSAAAATVMTFDAKATAANARQATATGVFMTRLSQPYHVYAAYSENGAASTGGDWTVIVKFM